MVTLKHVITNFSFLNICSFEQSVRDSSTSVPFSNLSSTDLPFVRSLCIRSSLELSFFYRLNYSNQIFGPILWLLFSHEIVLAHDTFWAEFWDNHFSDYFFSGWFLSFRVSDSNWECIDKGLKKLHFLECFSPKSIL